MRRATSVLTSLASSRIAVSRSLVALPRPALALRMASVAEMSTSADGKLSHEQIEKKLAELGYKLPNPSKPVASYVMCTRVGNILYLAGHLPQPAEGAMMTGKVGADLTTEEGALAARYVALNLLATLKSELNGDLGRVKKIVKLTGFVNCVDGFAAQPKVVNGASDTFQAVLGSRGVHSRSAVGTNALPLNVPVEIEAIVEVE